MTRDRRNAIDTVDISGRLFSPARRTFKTLLALASLLAVASTSFASIITLQWDPETAPDLAGYKVYYSKTPGVPLAGVGASQGASPVQLSTQTSATITGLDPGSLYYFAVTAFNKAGVESPYSNIVLVPELIPPTVSLSTSIIGTTATGTVSLSASASDNVGVTRVEFYVNGVLQSSDTASPFLFSWNTSTLASGAYTLFARAYDAAGNVGQSGTVSLTVAHDLTAPKVYLTAPGNGATVLGVVPLAASATDNVGVTKVEFYANGTLLSAGNVAPYSHNWDTAGLGSGTYLLSARAYDAAGNVGISPGVSVTVSPPPITLLDVQLALQLASGVATPTSAQLQRLDVAPLVNGKSIPNGIIDNADVLVLLSMYLGVI
jgi:chitinase